MKHVGMSAILCYKIISYEGKKIKVSKLTHDTLVINYSVGGAQSLDPLHSIQFGGKIFNTSMKLMCSDFWWNLMNDISKYLFLEQLCQFSEGVLKFLSEAGDSIHSFSSCTHTGALKTEWKCRISLKSAYLYTSSVQAHWYSFLGSVKSFITSSWINITNCEVWLKMLNIGSLLTILPLYNTARQSFYSYGRQEWISHWATLHRTSLLS